MGSISREDMAVVLEKGWQLLVAQQLWLIPLLPLLFMRRLLLLFTGCCCSPLAGGSRRISAVAVAVAVALHRLGKKLPELKR